MPRLRELRARGSGYFRRLGRRGHKVHGCRVSLVPELWCWKDAGGKGQLPGSYSWVSASEEITREPMGCRTGPAWPGAGPWEQNSRPPTHLGLTPSGTLMPTSPRSSQRLLILHPPNLVSPLRVCFLTCDVGMGAGPVPGSMLAATKLMDGVTRVEVLAQSSAHDN